MVYTPNTFTTSTLSFLIQFKIKERQQRIYFRKFREGKLWRHVKSKKLRDKCLQKNIQKCKIVTFLPFKYNTINITYLEQFCILTYDIYILTIGKIYIFDPIRYVSTINSCFFMKERNMDTL